MPMNEDTKRQTDMKMQPWGQQMSYGDWPTATGYC